MGVAFLEVEEYLFSVLPNVHESLQLAEVEEDRHLILVQAFQEVEEFHLEVGDQMEMLLELVEECL